MFRGEEGWPDRCNTALEQRFGCRHSNLYFDVLGFVSYILVSFVGVPGDYSTSLGNNRTVTFCPCCRT